MVSEKSKRLKLFYTDYELAKQEQEAKRRRASIEWRLTMLMYTLFCLLLVMLIATVGVMLYQII